MTRFTLIFIGAGLGGVLRYALGTWIQTRSGAIFPIGTLTVNVLGCVLIGFLGSILAANVVREEYRLAIVVGVLGGFTTFSTFGMETAFLISRADWWRAGLNIVLSNALGLLAVWAGMRAADWL